MVTTTADQITIHTVTHYAPGAAWVHTHGMAQFGYPDLEWYWSPLETCGEAEAMLHQLALHIIRAGAPVRVGGTVGVRRAGMALRFLEALGQREGCFGGNDVLRVEEVTTGARAVRTFRAILEAGPDGALAHNRRGVAFQLEGKFVDAWLEYEKALEADSKSVYALANLGHLLLQQGDAEEALPFLLRAVELEPRYALAHNNLGNCYMHLGRVEEAAAQYREAAVQDACYAMPHRNLALSYHLLGRLDEAVEEYRAYFRLAPSGTKDADAHFNLGVMLEEAGAVAEAAEEYEKALADDPRHAKALNNLGLVRFSRGEVDAAVEFYRRALEAEEGFVLARYNLGLALAARGEHGAAAEEFGRVLALAPDNVQAASNLGVLYTTLARYDEAVEIFERLVAAEPSQPTLRFNLALAYQGKGLSEKSDAELREVIELEPPGSPRAVRARREMASAA